MTLSCGLLFAPSMAFVLGHRGAPIENRARVAFSGLDRGWSSLTDLGRYLADRLPLRARAVRDDGWIDQHVFHEDPAFGGTATPRVISGKDGFLFLADAIDNACQPNDSAPNTVQHLQRLAQLISGSGRVVLTMVAPDKSTVHPELLPTSMPKRECFDKYVNELWPGLDAAGIPGFVNLRNLLLAASSKTREALYLRKDSHWDPAGSIVAVRAAIEALAPGMWRESEVHYEGLAEYTGDLTSLQGNPRPDQEPVYSILRPDVTAVSVETIDETSGGLNRHFVNTAPAGRLIPGKTVMFLDSYGLVALPQIVPFFADLTVIRLVDFNADRFTKLITDSDRVWIMSVERSLAYRLTYEIGSQAFLDQLESALKK